MFLIANGVELIFKYSHIDRFILISGDGDFRPLLLALKKYGKETIVVCDISKNASEELVKMADNAIDYREIIKEMDEFEDISTEIDENENTLTKENAFELFKETIGILIQENKKTVSTAVKTRMQLLNNQFDENKLGYSTWREFVEDAKSHTNITFVNGLFALNNSKEKTIPIIFEQLLNYLPENIEWVLFNQIGDKINYKRSGYNKFKKLALDAEMRGYVEIKNVGLDWSMKRK
jgi:hypothetical protein